MKEKKCAVGSLLDVIVLNITENDGIITSPKYVLNIYPVFTKLKTNQHR